MVSQNASVQPDRRFSAKLVSRGGTVRSVYDATAFLVVCRLKRWWLHTKEDPLVRVARKAMGPEVLLYHGTSSARLASIRRNGLRPLGRISRSDLVISDVYLTSDAKYAASHALAKAGPSRAVVLAVRVPRDWLRPYGEGGWTTSRPVPPERIVGIERARGA